MVFLRTSRLALVLLCAAPRSVRGARPLGGEDSEFIEPDFPGSLLDGEETGNASATRTEAGVAVEALLSTANAFLAEHAEEVLALKAQSSMVRGMEAAGITIEQRFRLAVLRRVLEGEIEEQEAREREMEEGTVILQDATTQLQLLAHNSTLNPLDVTLHTNEHRPCTEEWYNKEVAYLQINRNDEQAVAGTKDGLKSFCIVKRFVDQRQQADFGQKDEIKGLDEIHGDMMPGKMYHAEPIRDQDGARITAGDVQTYRKIQGLKRVGWLQKLNPTSKLFHDTRLTNNGASALEEAKGLYLEALILYGKVGAMAKYVEYGKAIDWTNVKASKGILSRVGHKIGRFFKGVGKYIAATAKNAWAYVKNVWAQLTSGIRKDEQKCSNEASQASVTAAKANGLPDSPKSQVEAERMAEQQEELLKTPEAIDNQAKRAGNALASMERKVSHGYSEKKMQASAAIVKKENQALEADMKHTGPGKTSREQKAKLKQISRVEKETARVSVQVCKKDTLTMCQKLSKFFKAAKKAVVNTIKTPFPTLGIRGASMSIGGMGAAGAVGLEEVIDFRNREIGVFRYGAAAVGGSTEVSFGLGGYAGIGWKGYKENWTLQDAYQTGVWMTTGVGVSGPMFFGVEMSGAVTFSTDADNSQPGPWILEPNGVNAALFGWGISTPTILSLISPVTFKYQVGMTKLAHLNTECYKSVGELIKYILWPGCNLCFAGTEWASVVGSRTFIKAMGMPIIADQIFVSLALLYEVGHRDRSYKPECSFLSTNNRENISSIVAKAGSFLYDAVDIVGRVAPDLTQIHTDMKQNSQVPLSEEYRKWHHKVGKIVPMCRTLPRHATSTDVTVESYKQLSTDDLAQKCTKYKLSIECAENEDTMLNRLGMATVAWDNCMSAEEAMDLRNDAERLKFSALSRKKLRPLIRACPRVKEPECCPKRNSWNIAMLLRRLGISGLKKWCKLIGMDCKKRHGILGVGVKWHDAEYIAFMLVMAYGGGDVQKASTKYPFGFCTSNSQCGPNKECRKIGFLEHMRCSCVEGYCYNQIDKSGPGVCQRQKDEELDVTMTRVRQAYKMARVDLGNTMRRFAQYKDRLRNMTDLYKDNQTFHVFRPREKSSV